SGSIAIPDKDSTLAVLKHKIVGNHDIIGGMPQMNPKGGVAVGDVVENVATQIGMINSLNGVAGDCGVADVMDHVADGVVIAGRPFAIDDPGAAIAGTGTGNVVHVVADDAHEGGAILNAQADAATDIETHDVHIVSRVGPHGIGAAALHLGAPLHVGDETDASACRSANRAADGPISSRRDVHRGAGRNAVG